MAHLRSHNSILSCHKRECQIKTLHNVTSVNILSKCFITSKFYTETLVCKESFNLSDSSIQYSTVIPCWMHIMLKELHITLIKYYSHSQYNNLECLRKFQLAIHWWSFASILLSANKNHLPNPKLVGCFKILFAHATVALRIPRPPQSVPSTVKRKYKVTWWRRLRPVSHVTSGKGLWTLDSSSQNSQNHTDISNCPSVSFSWPLEQWWILVNWKFFITQVSPKSVFSCFQETCSTYS